MGLLSWLKRKPPTPKRRVSAPPIPFTNYDRNGNRPEYKVAFNEFKERGSLYNQMTIREESEETGSQNTKSATDQSEVQNGVQQQDQPKSGTTKQHSLPNPMSRSMDSGPSNRIMNTPNSTLAVNENNNSIYVNEIAEFEGNCVNDASFGAAAINESPPKTFYRNNSNPFSQPPVTVPSTSSPSAQQTVPKLEDARQRARDKLMSFILPNARTANTSDSSGAYRHNDLDSISSVGADGASNVQPIPKDAYQEIVHIFQDFAQRTGARQQSHTQNSPARQQSHTQNSPARQQSHTQNSPARQQSHTQNSPARQQSHTQNSPSHPRFDNEISGISPLSAFTSFRRCEGVVDENFAFLNETEFRNCMDESQSNGAVNHGRDANARVTDLDESTEPLSEHDEENVESSREIDAIEQRSQNIDSTTSPQANKHPIYVIECKAKDIKPISSALRNTLLTPFHLSTGSFRKTTVTVKKCCPRDTASIRLVEEAIERDFEILSKVKHSNIVILMAACINRKLINHMTLVMEPVDYTLNYYLHQMDKSLSTMESIALVQQIASAALYLQECGYIHSNISSHNVLVREHPFSGKLSSFELATEIDPTAVRDEVNNLYPQYLATQSGECSSAQQSIGDDDDNATLKNQYRILSKRATDFSANPEADYMDIPSKYLVYDKTYRQHLSLPNLTAPELLAIDRRFVFPTPRTDIYSLCLLLWEVLNKRVPFAVYSRLDMERMIVVEKLNLPFFEHQRCFFFMEIFGAGLELKPENRGIDLPQFIEVLDCIALEIETGGEYVPDEYVPDESSDCDEEHDNTNYTQQQEDSEHFDDTVVSSVSSDPVQLSDNNANALKSFVLSPSLLDFDKSLKESERTSTKRLRNKPPRNHIGQGIRELFPAVDEAAEVGPTVVGYSVKNRKLNESKTHGNFLETPVAAVAKKLFNFSPHEPQLNSERLTDAMPDTPIARQNYITRNAWLSNQKPDMSSKNVEVNRMTNGIDKEAGPSDVNTRVNVSVRIVHNKMTPEKAVTVTKIQPKQFDEARPSVLSKIQFFNSTSETIKSGTPLSNGKRPTVSVKTDEVVTPSQTSKTGVPLSNGKHPTTSVQADEVISNNKSPEHSDKIVNEPAVAPEEAANIVSNGTSKNERKAIINELTNAMHNLQRGSVDQPQKKQLFENRLWKRELDICNRSLNSSDISNGSKIVAPKFRSVRDTILKFEKRGEVTKSKSTSNASTELPYSSPKPNSLSQSNYRKPSDSPALIKRTNYSERMVSGIDLSPPTFDKLNFGSHSGESLTGRCQTSVKVQDTRSIEDLYIDDDYLHGLGANMELQSNCSDLLDLDMFSSGLFNSNYDNRS